jgi:hypothetical protein
LRTEINVARREYTDYQRSVISGYYSNSDAIMLQRVAELVSELYVADTEAKKDRLWQRVRKAMTNLKIPPAIADHILSSRDAQVLAKNLQDWQKGKMGSGAGTSTVGDEGRS